MSTLKVNNVESKGTGSDAKHLVLATNGYTRMTVLSTGNVGIGTDSPSYALHVATNTGYLAYFQNTSTTDHRPIGFTDDQNIVRGTIGINTTTNDFHLGDASGISMTLNSGNVGIGTAAPGQILDVNSGAGNMIADGYDTHSLAVYKENIEDASGYLDKIKACPAQKWNRKPFISANKIKEVTIEEFGEEAWMEYFPDKTSHKNKALYNMPEGDMKTWIDEWCETKRTEMRPEAKWQQKKLGLVADAESTAEHLPEVIAINDDGEPAGIDTMTYIGVLHNALQETLAKVEGLETRIEQLEA